MSAPRFFCLHFPFYGVTVTCYCGQLSLQWVLEIQTQVLTLLQQELYPMSQLSSHTIPFSITDDGAAKGGQGCTGEETKL